MLRVCLFKAFVVYFVVAAAADQVKAEEILVVTAAQPALPKSAIGSSVTVITADAIQKQGFMFVSDILRTVPGFALSQSGSFGTVTDLRVRGAEANHTQVLIDGIEVNDPAIGSAFNFGFLTLDSVERIEIVRGPQSALFGSDAIGAVVNIITRTGQQGAAIRGSLELGGFDTIKTAIGSDFGNEYINYAINAEVLRTDGVNIAGTGSEKDGHHNRTYDLKLSVTPSDFLKLNFIARHTDSDTDTDSQSFPSPVITDSPGNHTAVDHTHLSAEARLSLARDRWRHRVRVDSTETRNQFASSNFGPSFTQGKREKYAYQTSFNFDTPAIDHTASFLYEYQDERSTGTFIGGLSEVGFISKSYAGEYHAGVFGPLFITAGVRFDDNAFFQNATTYRVTSAYHYHSSNTRLHASYGTGIKNPTLSELFGNFPMFAGNPNLKPESAIGWDAGMEQTWMNRWLVDVTYFNNAITDQITGRANTAANLSGTNRIDGVEMTAEFDWTRNLRLAGAYTYTHAKDADGRELIRRARHIASFNLNYAFLNDRANISLGVHYNGEQDDNVFTFPVTRTTLDAFTRVHVNARYRVNDVVGVYARVENLLDESYEEVFSYRAPGIGGFVGIELNGN